MNSYTGISIVRTGSVPRIKRLSIMIGRKRIQLEALPHQRNAVIHASAKNLEFAIAHVRLRIASIQFQRTFKHHFSAIPVEVKAMADKRLSEVAVGQRSIQLQGLRSVSAGLEFNLGNGRPSLAGKAWRQARSA